MAIGALSFGIAPSDPAILGGAVALLMTVAVVAAWLPARRAARIEPRSPCRTEAEPSPGVETAPHDARRDRHRDDTARRVRRDRVADGLVERGRVGRRHPVAREAVPGMDRRHVVVDRLRERPRPLRETSLDREVSPRRQLPDQVVGLELAVGREPCDRAPPADRTRATALRDARRGSAAATAATRPGAASAPASRTSGSSRRPAPPRTGPASGTPSTRPTIQVRLGASPPGSARARAIMRSDMSTAVIAPTPGRQAPRQLAGAAAEIQDVRRRAAGELDEQGIEAPLDTVAEPRRRRPPTASLNCSAW